MPRTGDRLAGEVEDDVPRRQSCLGCRRTGLNLGHQNALVDLDLELLSQRLRYRLDGHPEICPVDRAGRFQLTAYPLGEVRGNSEAHTLVTAATAGDRRIDADDVSVEVDQRATAVARVDGGVRLDEILTVGDANSALFCTDDSRRDRAFQPERFTQGQDPLADFNFVAVAEPGRRKRACALDAKKGQVGFRIRLDVNRLEFPSIVQTDHDFAATGNDMVVR